MSASIVDGKGTVMPAFGGKLNDDQVRDLVRHIRGFDGRQPKQSSTAPSDFEKRFRQLQEQRQEAEMQFRALSRRGKPSEPAEPRRPEATGPSAPKAAKTPVIREVFRQHCVKCHKEDGKGGQVPDLKAEVPDFTDASWQVGRSDPQLLASILDGKGQEMPSWRDKIGEEPARGLLAHVRAFAPTKATPKGGSQAGYYGRSLQEEERSSAEFAERKPSPGFFEGLIRWLGKFHPAAVNFPVALLSAAAVAELLRMATGRPAFDVAARYCLWFGFLTAVVAGILGWFTGGFQLTDASWIIRTHRWLGTSTVACAGLVLALSQASRRPDCRRSLIWFRVMLLVVALLVAVTGFFGGAVVFGIDHYTWPQ